MNLEEYKTQIADYLKKNMNYTEQETKDSLQEYDKILPKCFKNSWGISATATMIYNEL